MKKVALTAIMILLLGASESFAQEKQLWATAYLNKKAPALHLKNWITEKPDTKGKFILLDFWATWCGPCKRGIPHMNAYSKTFKKDLVVIGISDETEAKVRSMATPKIIYYSALDTNSSLNKHYGIQGIPHAVLIDPDGIVRWEGFPSLKNHELSAAIISEIIENYKTKQ